MTGNCKAWLINSKNERFDFDNDIWGITNIQGIFSPNFKVYRQTKANGDGSRVTGRQATDRDIVIESATKRQSTVAQDRETANRYLTLHENYKLYITYNGITRWTNCVLDGCSCIQSKPFTDAYLKVLCYCEYPYMFSEDGFGKDISARVPRFAFPYVSTVEDGFITGYYAFQYIAELNNKGFKPSSNLTVTFSARGNVKNPSITKNGVETMRVITDMVQGDVVVVDFFKGKIIKNNQRYSNIDPASVFFELDEGINVLKADADSDIANLAAKVWFFSEYEGI